MTAKVFKIEDDGEWFYYAAENQEKYGSHGNLHENPRQERRRLYNPQGSFAVPCGKHVLGGTDGSSAEA